MKLLEKIALVFALITMPVLAASAQENVEEFNPEYNESRDENGNIQNDSYITNPWYDNWTIGIAGGVQTQLGQKLVAKVNPAVEVYVIKWFTPNVAARLGYTGFNGYEAYKDGFTYSYANLGDHSFWQGNANNWEADKQYTDLRYNRHQFHFDVMWNIINTFWGYQYNRVWTVSPYLTGGYMRLYAAGDKWSTGRHDNEMFAGVGLYNAFRISKHFNITLDLRSNFYSARYHWKEGGVVSNLVGTVGLSYTIHKWYWNRSKPLEVARDNALASAEASKAAAKQAADDAVKARSELAAANAEIAKLKADAPKDGYVVVSPEAYTTRAAAAEHVVYYMIDNAEINATEQKHFDAYVASVLAKDPKHVFYLTGKADKGTGSEKANVEISRERAEGVKAALMKKHNVPEDQIVIKATVVSDEHSDGSFDRCVLIENK